MVEELDLDATAGRLAFGRFHFGLLPSSLHVVAAAPPPALPAIGHGYGDEMPIGMGVPEAAISRQIVQERADAFAAVARRVTAERHRLSRAASGWLDQMRAVDGQVA
jgi:hypothetical protein